LVHLVLSSIGGMKQHPTIAAPTDPVEYERWLNGIVRLAEAARLRGVHPETLRREAARGRIKAAAGLRTRGWHAPSRRAHARPQIVWRCRLRRETPPRN
jgi:hypothetical protein